MGLTGPASRHCRRAMIVVGLDIDGNPSYDVSETGAADAVKATARTATAATSTARKARNVPGVAQPEARSRAPWPPRTSSRSRAMTS